MSLRKFNPFSSKSSVNSNRDFDAQSSRPPSFVSRVTAAPTYKSGAASTVYESAWSASIAGGSIAPSSYRGTTISDDTSSFADTASIVTSTGTISPSSPRYVYYRLYTVEGAIPSKNPVSSEDIYLSRVLAKMVAPPHTVASIKRCLAKIEDLGDPASSKLFIAASSQEPMAESSRVSILRATGPGSMPHEPMSLVVEMSNVESRVVAKPTEGSEASVIPEDMEVPSEPQYIYYGLYNDEGAVESKQPVDPNDPFVGRINVTSVAPPHTSISLKRCISKAEGIKTVDNVMLYVDISGECPIEGRVSVLGSNRPGSSLDEPLAFVQSAFEAPPPPEPELPGKRPIDPKYKKKVKALYQSDKLSIDPQFLNIKKGEILLSDGFYSSQLNQHTKRNYNVYRVVNADGHVGFVPEYMLEFR